MPPCYGASNNQVCITIIIKAGYVYLHATLVSVLQEEVKPNIYNANGALIRTYIRGAEAGLNTWDVNVSGLVSGIDSVAVILPHQLADDTFFKN